MVSSDDNEELSKENSFLPKYSCLLFPVKMKRHRRSLYVDLIAQLVMWSHNAEEYISSNTRNHRITESQKGKGWK